MLQSLSAFVANPSTRGLKRRSLPHAKDVVAWQLKVEHHAQSSFTMDLEAYGKMTMVVARAYRDAAMLAMMFGYLPPLRLSCVRTCYHPDFVGFGMRCMEEGCR